jgi:signal transduction histidine kinase
MNDPTRPRDASPTSDLLEHQPFPELAHGLRSRIPDIIKTWTDEIRKIVPAARDLPFDELVDNLPRILSQMAGALEAPHSEETRKLLDECPKQGLTRFRQEYAMADLMLEDRVLRRIITTEVRRALGRNVLESEQVALDMAIDAMLQQAVIAFADQQQARIRSDAETQLKYLSFLSHDLRNNLNHVTLFLQVLRQRLARLPDFAEDVEGLDVVQQSILDTIGGMGRLVQSERLRKAGVEPKRGPVNLHRLAMNVGQHATMAADQKGLRITVEVPPDAQVDSDGELVTLILQNLVGNAVKYTSNGVVRIGATLRTEDQRWVISVSDEGPGIAREHMARIFDAFRRGDSYGQPGVGLGLTIASQAAKLLGAELTVESSVGDGSRFRLILPAIGGGDTYQLIARHVSR